MKRCTLLLVLMLAACNTAAPATPTPTLVPTATSTLSPTLAPTAEPSPTLTPTPVPAIGELLRSDNWEGTVLQAVFRKSFTIAGTVYTPKPGHIVVDVVMKVRNLNATMNPSTNVENDVIVDAQGKSVLATCWGALDTAKAKGKDLPNITFVGCQTGNIYSMKIDNESYLRFLFTLEATNLGKPIVFKFEDLPLLPLVIGE